VVEVVATWLTVAVWADCLAGEVAVGWTYTGSSSLLSPCSILWIRAATDEDVDGRQAEVSGGKVVVTWPRWGELGTWRVDKGVGSLAVTVAVS